MVWLDDLVTTLCNALQEHHAGVASADVEAIAQSLTELELRCRSTSCRRSWHARECRPLSTGSLLS